jgi:hypothetical protein
LKVLPEAAKQERIYKAIAWMVYFGILKRCSLKFKVKFKS